MKVSTLGWGLLFSLNCLAQDHLAVRLNESGLMKILKTVVTEQTASAQSRSFTIPKNLYSFSIPKSQILSNPIVPILNEISNLNLNKDIPFYLSTSDIKILGSVDAQSLKVSTQNSGPKGFDVKLSINLPSITVTASKLSLCEDAVKKKKICGSGLKVEVSNLKIKTVTRPITVTAVLRLRTDNNVARMKVVSVDSNLEGGKGPILDFNNFGLTIPRVALVINGQETELDTSRLYTEIKEREDFLGKKLLAFAADFVAEDLASLINKYLVKEEIQTSWQILQGSSEKVSFNEFLNERSYYEGVARDGTYVKMPVVPNFIKSIPQKVNYPTLMETIIDKFVSLLKKSELGIQTERVSIPSKNDIEIGASINFKLKNETIFVRPYLANTNDREIPKVVLNQSMKSDANIALSEPLLNGFLDVVANSGFLDNILSEQLRMKGVYLAYNNKVRVHVSKRKSLIAVANLRINLDEVDSKGAWAKVENLIGQLLESRTTHGVFHFPLQFEFVPKIVRDSSGNIKINMFIKSPTNNSACTITKKKDGKFSYAPVDCIKIANDYKYPINLQLGHERVRHGILSTLDSAIKDGVNKSYPIDVTKFLNQSNAEFVLKNIGFEQEAYIVIDTDIKNIKF